MSWFGSLAWRSRANADAGLRSVAEAQAQTGLLDKLQYGLKSLIWL